MYAKSLYEHTIKAVRGKELRITFHRMDVFKENKGEDSDIDDDDDDNIENMNGQP